MKKLNRLILKYSKKEEYEDYLISLTNIKEKIQKHPELAEQIIKNEIKEWNNFMTFDFAEELRSLL